MDGAMAMKQEAQFIADAMLGKLTKWLRVMGMDVMYDANASDAEMLQSAERGARILLTRDRRLIRRRRPVQRLYIDSDYYHEQVRQVVQTFHLADRIQMFSRCIRCNTPLRAIAKQAVAGKVPPYVYTTQTAFKHCAACNRLYWGGTHRDNMRQQLQAMLGALFPSTPAT
jgi:hypothetical protein